jgi:hypothetical protein
VSALKQWLLKVWFDDSSAEECVCSTQHNALGFAQALMRDYQGRISCLSIANLARTFEVVIDRRSHRHTASSPIFRKSA